MHLPGSAFARLCGQAVWSGCMFGEVAPGAKARTFGIAGMRGMNDDCHQILHGFGEAALFPKFRSAENRIWLEVSLARETKLFG